MANRTLMIAIVAVAVLGASGAGYWLGQNPSKDTEDAANAADQPPSVGRWKLEAQFEGPLKDTVVQRWRDPKTEAVCYIYLPVIVQHSEPLQNGMVHYGNAGTGSISCVQPKS